MEETGEIYYFKNLSLPLAILIGAEVMWMKVRITSPNARVSSGEIPVAIDNFTAQYVKLWWKRLMNIYNIPHPKFNFTTDKKLIN